MARNDNRLKQERFQIDNFKKNMERLQKARIMAERTGVTLPQLAIAWALSKGDPIIPFIGCKTIKHLEENLGALRAALSEVDIALLDEAYPPGIAVGSRYPQAELAKWHQ